MQIILNLIVITGEIEKQNAAIQLKNQPPIQIRPAFVKFFAKLANRKARVQMRSAETANHQLDGVRNFLFTPRIADNFLNRLDSSTEIIFASGESSHFTARTGRLDFGADPPLRFFHFCGRESIFLQHVITRVNFHRAQRDDFIAKHKADVFAGHGALEPVAEPATSFGDGQSLHKVIITSLENGATEMRRQGGGGIEKISGSAAGGEELIGFIFPALAGINVALGDIDGALAGINGALLHLFFALDGIFSAQIIFSAPWQAFTTHWQKITAHWLIFAPHRSSERPHRLPEHIHRRFEHPHWSFEHAHWSFEHCREA